MISFAMLCWVGRIIDLHLNGVAHEGFCGRFLQIGHRRQEEMLKDVLQSILNSHFVRPTGSIELRVNTNDIESSSSNMI